MPRIIRGAAPGDELTFIPTYDGNAESPDPAKVIIRAPTQADKRAHLLAVSKLSQSIATTPDAELERVMEACRVTIEMFVLRVEGYADASGPIATAKDLWERGETRLADEVGGWIMGLLGLSEPQQKNSDGSSASSQAATQVSSGTAASASPTASTSTATATAAPAQGSSTSSLVLS